MLAGLWAVDKLERGNPDGVEQFGWYPFDRARGEFSYHHINGGSVSYRSEDKVGGPLLLFSFLE